MIYNDNNNHNDDNKFYIKVMWYNSIHAVLSQIQPLPFNYRPPGSARPAAAGRSRGAARVRRRRGGVCILCMYIYIYIYMCMHMYIYLL